MEVSYNGETPKSSISIGFLIINPYHLGYPILWMVNWMDTRINYPKLCGYPNDPKWIYLFQIFSNHKLHISIFLIINPYNVGIFMDSSSSLQIAPTPFTTNPSFPATFRCSSSPENSWMKRWRNWQAPFVQWEFQDPKMEVLYHMFGHMNCGDIPEI